MNIFKKKEALQPDLSQLLSEFNRSLMLIVDMSLLINYFISKVKQICPVESVYIFLLDEDTGKYKLQNGEDTQPYILTSKGRLLSWLSVNEKHLILSSHTDILTYFSAEEQTILKELDTELIYPLKVMNHISGTIFLGKKTNGSEFNEQDIHLLSFLFDQVAFAFEHVSLYEKQTERIKKMYRTDRLATLGELAAGAAHEIRNPLTAIRSTIQYLSKDFTDDPVKSEMTAQLITEVERINKIVQGLLSFARPSQLNTSEVNLEQLVNETLLLVQSTLKKQQVEVEFEYFTQETKILADREQLKQVLLNIILNAIEAMSSNKPGKPRNLIISLEKGADIDTHNRFLILSVEDTGNGIDEKDQENIFNPFFTTKEEGTGLGLAISYGVINRHEGEIKVKSTPGKGTAFIIKLPQRK
ncbi:MAG: ATP-binding protein [Tannerellaceae bacterium]|nr:ATP-binding protein [Tannerellaceae bacterium]